MTLLKWARLWVDCESVSTVAELYLSEAVRCSAIIDKNVVRLNVCRSNKNGCGEVVLGGLNTTCVDITTAVKPFQSLQNVPCDIFDIRSL